MPNNRSIWLIVLSTVLFFGAAFVTLRAAEQAGRTTAGAPAALAGPQAVGSPQTLTGPQAVGSPQTLAGPQTAGGTQARTRTQAGSPPTHPPASAPEESATITDDPTTAPDPSQSADNNVSFPNDI
jgi:hypothetical protein